MRLAVFVISFYLVFGQIYQAHAMFPVAVATARGVGTLVKAGKIIKGGAIWGGGALYLWCKANKAKCKDLAGDTAELILGDDDDSSDANCKIIRLYDLNYEHKKNGGEYSLAYKHSGDGHRWYRTKDSLMSEIQSRYEKIYNTQEMQDRYPLVDSTRFPLNDRYSQVVNSDRFKKDFENNCDRLQVGQYYVVHEFLNGKKVALSDGNSEWYYQGFLGAYKMSDDMAAEEQEEKEKELWDKLKDKLSDDDITNIVNNYGDDIDIDKYCASGATCYFIEPEFEKEINNNDYDIDKIDDKNCNTRNGKIYSCPDARKKKDRDDDDGQTNNDDDDKRDDGQTEKDKDDNGLPIPRLPNFVMPDFCTWASWFCQDEVKKTDGEINIDNDDLPADSVNINFGGACPASHNFPFRLGGYTFTFTMSYTYICQIAQSNAFIVKVLSTMVAIYILLGIKS